MSKGRRIFRQLAVEIASDFLDHIHNAYDYAVVCGSVRRMKDTVGDLDIVIVPKTNNKMSKALIMVFGRDSRIGKYRDTDIQLVPCMDFEIGAAVLYATGSSKFNLYMRAVAKSKNLLLNRNGLWRRDKTELLASSSEEAIFKALGMKYIEPEGRNEYYQSSWS